MSREVYGRIYETIEAGQREREHRYVGKTTTTIHQRVHGKGAWAHTSPQSIRKDPWKANILPGKAGYRQLEVVYATGDRAEDERALRRAEAFWIDRLRPTRNAVRPVRPRTEPERKPIRRKRRPIGRPLALLAVIGTVTFLAAKAILMMQLPWPEAPWVAAPTFGIALGWPLFWKLHRAARRTVRPSRR